MIDMALDSNNDLIVEDGRFKRVSDGAQVVQNVRSRLQFYMAEWFLDLQAGTPYFQEIFIRPANLANIESIFKSRILDTPDVQRLTEFAMSYEGGSARTLTVDFSADTTFGTIDITEVTING
jgi:hypothetical protein